MDFFTKLLSPMETTWFPCQHSARRRPCSRKEVVKNAFLSPPWAPSLLCPPPRHLPSRLPTSTLPITPQPFRAAPQFTSTIPSKVKLKAEYSLLKRLTLGGRKPLVVYASPARPPVQSATSEVHNHPFQTSATTTNKPSRPPL